LSGASTAAADLERLGAVLGESGEGAVDRIFRMASSKGGADISQLLRVRTAVGDQAWDELASAIIGRMGQDKDGFSVAKFRTQYAALSENGKNALFTTTGKQGLKQSLDDIAIVGQKFEELQRLGNPSGTMRAGSLVTGALTAFTAPLTVIASAVGGRLLAQYLANPAKARKIADFSKAYLDATIDRTPAKMRAYEIAARNLANMIDEDSGEAGPVRVNTIDDALRLPPGTQFETPDGRLKVR
jgi:hypothetical protein